MELRTAASVISYISEIEQETAKFYEQWARKHESVREIFSSFVKENKRNETNIKRAYYSVISDALETGFSFKGLEAELLRPVVDADTPLLDILKKSLELEQRIQDFYLKAAALSKSLLADVPRAMERVAKSRDSRKAKLRFLMEEVTT